MVGEQALAFPAAEERKSIEIKETSDLPASANDASDLVVRSGGPPGLCSPGQTWCAGDPKGSWITVCNLQHNWIRVAFCDGSRDCCKKRGLGDTSNASCGCKTVLQNGKQVVERSQLPASINPEEQSQQIAPLTLQRKDQCSSTCTSALQGCKKVRLLYVFGFRLH